MLDSSQIEASFFFSKALSNMSDGSKKSLIILLKAQINMSDSSQIKARFFFPMPKQYVRELSDRS